MLLRVSNGPESVCEHAGKRPRFLSQVVTVLTAVIVIKAVVTVATLVTSAVVTKVVLIVVPAIATAVIAVVTAVNVVISRNSSNRSSNSGG